ncbi:DNRLRE domain-containing protein [Aestuariimicrobium soli]|uniref:DNRLRE domain-containing protein n=1 Tax=Aestuariimicrobium soli TaxID=2035834 RepID=UPI003EB912D0
MTVSKITAVYTGSVRQAQPTQTFYRAAGYLPLNATAGSQQRAVIWFANPFPASGANVASAKLVLRTRALAASATISARLAAKWNGQFAKGLNWSNQPAQVGATASLAKTGAQPANAVWELDVTAQMQLVASGQGFYGFVVYTSSTSTVPVQEPMMGAAVAPQLVVDWSVAPLAPTSLSPAGGRVVSVAKPTLRFDFFDSVGATSIGAVQVQTNSTSSFTAPAFDSGTVATTVEQLDLSSAAFVAPASGATTWWRVRVQDSGGLWSPWSAPVSWVYRPLPTVTITAPASGTVTDPTPPIAWSTSGGTQSAFRVLINRQLPGGGWATVDESGWQVSAATSWTPSKPMGITGTHRVWVLVRDTYAREATPGGPVQAEVLRDVTFAPGATAGVTGLSVSMLAAGARLAWSRSQAPDEWIIYRDGVSVARVPGVSLSTGGTGYAWTDLLAPGGAHTWRVYAVVNKIAAPASSASGTFLRKGVWLLDPDDLTASVVVAGVGVDQDMPEVGATFEPVGARTAVRIVSAQRGWEGSMSGRLMNLDNGTTASTWRDRLLEWKPQVGKTLWMLAWDQAFRVVISEVYVGGNELRGGEDIWDVRFSYRQVDDFAFDPMDG